VSFTTIARSKTEPYWEGSFGHPFIKELQKGSLDEKIFRYYLIQDDYYLKHFSRLYQLVGDKADDQYLKDLLYTNAHDLKIGEQAIREVFFDQLGIDPNASSHTKIAPTAYHYVSHMYRQLSESNAAIAAASLLPCAWLYHDIGEQLIKQGSPTPIYQQWIETYATEEATQKLNSECQVLNRHYDNSSLEDQQKMVNAFVISSQMEYAFWEMAYTFETWPEGNLDYVNTIQY